MRLLIAAAFYSCALVFYWRFASMFLRWRRGDGVETTGASQNGFSCPSVCVSIVDVAMLRRLFLDNKCLWLGEWVFHVSFALVSIRHLKYILLPVPKIITCIQPLGVAAGYALPISIAYILIYRLIKGRSAYVSRYNLILTVMMLAISSIGVFMRYNHAADVVAAKQYVLSLLSFSPGHPLENAAFNAHLLIAVVFMASVPAHVIAALVTSISGRARDMEIERGLLSDGRQ